MLQRHSGQRVAELLVRFDVALAVGNDVPHHRADDLLKLRVLPLDAVQSKGDVVRLPHLGVLCASEPARNAILHSVNTELLPQTGHRFHWHVLSALLHVDRRRMTEPWRAASHLLMLLRRVVALSAGIQLVPSSRWLPVTAAQVALALRA